MDSETGRTRMVAIRGSRPMLLPIVLLLASSGPIQQAANVAAASIEQSATSSQPLTLVPDPGPRKFVIGPSGNRRMLAEPIRMPDPGPNSFVHKPRPGNRRPDTGIIVPRPTCDEHHPCVCASITAYVFSDGENPQFQYVTYCPNRDVPNQMERARDRLPETEQQPDLKRTKY